MPSRFQPATRRHAFGFDAIMADPDFSRFQDWYARRNLLAPSRHQIEAIFSQPEDALDRAA